MIKKLLPILLIYYLFLTLCCSVTKNGLIPFGVAYNKLGPQDIEDYSLIILEPDHYSKLDVDELKSENVKLIAYLSLSEVDSNRWYFPLVEEYGFLGNNPNWSSCYMDLSKKEVIDILLNTVVSNIMIKGFDGLFFDTVDGVNETLGRGYIQDEMIFLISQIRKNYPDVFLIQNGGLFILDKTRPYLDAVLIESVASDYSFFNQMYGLRSELEFEKKIMMINNYSNLFDIDFLIVEFADNKTLADKIKNRLNKYGYPLFISKFDLSSLPKVR